MKWLLLSVFLFWGTHTSLWLQRSIVAIVRREFVIDSTNKQYIRRFSDLNRRLHGVVVTSFLGLVMTGLPLKYYYTPWAKSLCLFLGALETTRYFHRIFGLITIGYFFFHLLHVLYRVVVKEEKNILCGPDSFMPRKKDFVDLWANLEWFFYKGDRPRYDRWTYFEKFYYFAVFWGGASSGFRG